MPEPILTTCLAISGSALLTAAASRQHGVSEESTSLRNSLVGERSRFEASQALFGPKAAAFKRIEELKAECFGRGWDGEDADPMSAASLHLARSFLRLLPERFTMPDFGVDPDGEIAMDWVAGAWRTFSVSLSTKGIAACAWIDGAARGHFTVPFTEAEIPAEILMQLERFAIHDTPQWTA